MARFWMMVGLPGSGKSTWCQHYLRTGNNLDGTTVRISSDDKIDEFAAKFGLTYTEAFKQVDLKAIEREIRQEFEAALEAGHDIIIDRTNMSRKSRASWLSQVPDTYFKYAVVLECDSDELNARLEGRAAQTGKEIPSHVVKSMRESFEAPSKAEGFNWVFGKDSFEFPKEDGPPTE